MYLTTSLEPRLVQPKPFLPASGPCAEMLEGGALVVFSTHTQGGPKTDFLKLRSCKAAMDIPGRQVPCSDVQSVDAERGG